MLGRVEKTDEGACPRPAERSQQSAVIFTIGQKVTLNL